MSRIAKLIASIEEHSDEMKLEVPEVEEVSPEDEEEADFEIEVAEVENEETEEEVQNDDTAIGELEEEEVALEGFIEILQYGIENKEYSTQFAASVATRLAPYAENKLFGIPSLEDYNGDAVESYYVASLEAAKDVVQKIKDSITVMQSNLSRKVKAAGSEKAFAKTSITKADALLKRLGNVKTDEATIRTAGVTRYLGIEGKLPNDIASTAKTDLKNRQLITDKFAPATEAFFVKVMDVLTLRTSPFIPDEESDKILSVKHPTELLTKDIREGKGLFSASIEVEAPKSDSDKKVTQLINYAGIKPKWKFKAPKSVPEEIKLTKANIKAILIAAKTYSVFVQSTKIPDFAALDVSKKFTFEKGMKPIVLNAIVRAQFSSDLTVFNLLINTRHLTLSLLQIAERAIKVLEKEKKAD